MPEINKIEMTEEEQLRQNRRINSKKLTSKEPIINTLNQNNDYYEDELIE
jgi:hypothetical protein